MPTKKKIYMVSTGAGQLAYANAAHSRFFVEDKDEAVDAAKRAATAGKIGYYVLEAVVLVEPAMAPCTVTELN